MPITAWATGDVITAARLNHPETRTTPSISANTLTLDLSLGANFGPVTLNANITTLTISNPPAAAMAFSFTVVFRGDGTQRTITLPASVKTSGGVGYTPTATLNKDDLVQFTTFDGGTSWLMTVGGQAF